MAKIRTQADRRQHATVTDQHGRKFYVVIEKDTMHPCSQPTPIGWNPPLLGGKKPFLPPQQYQTFAPNDPFRMEINYDLWIADVEGEHTSRADKIGAAAVMMFGSGAADAIKRNDPELMRYVGKPPMPLEPIKAAKQGNQFALGLSPRMPNWAIPFFTAPVIKEEIFEDVYDDVEEEPRSNAGSGADDDFETATDNEDRFTDTIEGEPEEPVFGRAIVDEDLEEIEEEVDPDAVGGRRMDPRARRAGGKGARRPAVAAGRGSRARVGE